MKRLTVLIISLLIGTACLADSTASGTYGFGSAAGGECTETAGDYLVYQNFEGAGYDNSESWTEDIGSGGSVGEDDTTATVLRGSQQLKIVGGSGDYSRSYANFDAVGNLWIHFSFKATDASVAGGSLIMVILNDSYEQFASLGLTSTGQLDLYLGTSNTTSTATVSDNTETHIWLHLVKGTGANGAATVYWGTSATRPSADANLTITNSNQTGDAINIMLRADAGSTFYFDEVMVDDAEIGSVCD